MQGIHSYYVQAPRDMGKLISYAETFPDRLPQIGAYFEKVIARDLGAARYGWVLNVIVSYVL